MPTLLEQNPSQGLFENRVASSVVVSYTALAQQHQETRQLDSRNATVQLS
jgi:hypothetical protein